METTDSSSNKGEISSDLVAILCCPETKQGVSLLPNDTLQELNQKISQGEVQNKGGTQVTESLDGGLVRKDGLVVYPIRDQIPIMLIEEGISIGQ